MNIRYPLYEGVYRILTHLKTLPQGPSSIFLMKNLPSHSIPRVFFMESLLQTP